MSFFLGIGFLAALPLAAAPILLHFFDRRRTAVIEWGAMQFLQEAATRRTSARRLKEWLLLLLRVLALLALIFALAQPVVPGRWLGSVERAETIVVIDNSMSLNRDVDESTIFAQAIAHAKQTVSELKPGDSCRILLASPYPRWVTTGSVRVDASTKPKLTSQIDTICPTDGSSDLLAALFTVVQSDADPTLRQRRAIVVTDDQRTDWNTEDAAGWERLQTLLAECSIPTQVEVVEIASPPRKGNVALNEVRASRTITGVNQPVSLTAIVRNHGARPSRAGRITWTSGEQEIETRPIPVIEAGGAHEFVFKHTFQEAGVHSVACQLDVDDELAADNRSAVVVEVVERLPVLLVEDSDSLLEIQRDAFFVEAALGRLEAEENSNRWKAAFEPQTIPSERLESIDLDSYRAVVIPNLTELSEQSVLRLTEFVSRGGGLWIALGPRTDVDTFNHYLFNDGDGLSPLRIVGTANEQKEGGESKTKINPFGKDHPATAELADVERLDIGDVKVTGRFRFHAGLSYDDVSVLLDLTNGEPLAVEKYVGDGRVILQGVPLRYQWSDLVLSEAFVVMVHDWLAYLTQPRATQHNLAPGEPITIHLADSEQTEAKLMTPRGDEIDLASEPSSDGVMFRSSRTTLPGEYTLALGLSGDRMPFHVARDARESDLTGLTADDRRIISKTIDIGKAAVSEAAVSAKQRDPLWPLLLILLVLLIAGELLLAGVISRERLGSESIAETTEDWMEQATSLAGFNAMPSPSAPNGTRTGFDQETPRETEEVVEV